MGGPSPERRSQQRRHLATNGSNPVIATVGILPRAALVSDLSDEGLGLLTTFAPPLGAILPVWLPAPPGQPSHFLLATVVHVQSPSPDNLFQVGITCHDDAGRAILRELLARLPEDEGHA